MSPIMSMPRTHARASGREHASRGGGDRVRSSGAAEQRRHLPHWVKGPAHPLTLLALLAALTTELSNSNGFSLLNSEERVLSQLGAAPRARAARHVATALGLDPGKRW